jgi:hypothetical protein
MQPTRCPKCDGPMEPGFPLDATYGGVCEAKWVPGTPEKSFWTGLKVDRDKLLSIVSMRCTRCGFLENYAPGPAAQ